MKIKKQKYAYIVLVAPSQKEMKRGLGWMCQFKQGRVITHRGTKIAYPTFFWTRDDALTHIRKERQGLRASRKKLKEDIQYIRNKGLHRRYPEIVDLMKDTAYGMLRGSFSPVFKIQRVNLEKWRETLGQDSVIINGKVVI